eukprot:gene20398-26469_t
MINKDKVLISSKQYVSRLAPSPSGYLHVGHLQTFKTAYERVLNNNGRLIFRVEDLDIKRSWKKLLDKGYIYPCPYSRKDVERALSAPNEGDEEMVYPITLRPNYMINNCNRNDIPNEVLSLTYPTPINWRFRVPDGLIVRFIDNRCGKQEYITGKDFGDFIIWRSDGYPSYELAVVVDDADMNISEVVRGEDLLLSTARQLLLYYALDLNDNIPQFYHCSLVRDHNGKRLAKRDHDTTVKSLREIHNMTPTDIINKFFSK